MISQMHWRGLQLVAACEIKKVFNVRNHHESLCKWNVSGMWLSKLRLHVVVVHSINDASFVVDHYCLAAAALAGEILGCQAGLQVQIHSLSSEIPGPQKSPSIIKHYQCIIRLSTELQVHWVDKNPQICGAGTATPYLRTCGNSHPTSLKSLASHSPYMPLLCMRLAPCFTARRGMSSWLPNSKSINQCAILAATCSVSCT